MRTSQQDVRKASTAGMVAVAACAALLLSACASTPREAESVRLARLQAHAGAPVSSIPYTSTGSAGFDVVDDRHVLLTTRPTLAYLIRVSGPCLSFDRGSPSLAITSNMGRISTGFDQISSLKQPTLTCRIEEIRPVDVKAAREAEQAARQG